MWTDDEIRQILERLRRQGNDDGRFEAKSCATDIGSSVWESVSAFANTSGGTLLLGINEKNGFYPVDGFDQNVIASKLMEGMGDGNPQGVRLTNPPEYEISRCEYEHKPFLVVDIHENPIEAKPCYVTAKGPKSGGYRRMDDKDIRLSATEVFEFENATLPSPADRGIVPEATVNDLNAAAVDLVLTAHAGSKALRGAGSRTEQLARLNMTDNNGRVRLAGLLAAGQYPQQYYPKLLIDVSVHPDIEKSDPSGPRFLDRVLCDGNMPEAIDQAVEAVANNLRTPTFVIGAGARTDTEIPREVLREAIANAVIHREYDSRFTGEAVAVDVYPDRVEVSNPGGLWGGVTLETIASGISRCRNTTLVQLMHKVPYSHEGAVTVEGGGTGVLLIIREMASRALGAPKFEASPDHFKVTLARYGVEYQQNRKWLESLKTELSQREQTMLLLLRQQGTMSVERLHASLHIDSDDIRRILTTLIAKGLVQVGDDGAYALSDGGTSSMDAGSALFTPDGNLTKAECELLGLLSPSEALGAREISEMTGRSLPSVRKLLRRLIDVGMVIPTAPSSSRNRKYKRVS